jgi:hypothetical protein
MGVIQKKKIDWSVANPLFIKITIYFVASSPFKKSYILQIFFSKNNYFYSHEAIVPL